MCDGGGERGGGARGGDVCLWGHEVGEQGMDGQGRRRERKRGREGEGAGFCGDLAHHFMLQ
jgi:hypothetical protein